MHSITVRAAAKLNLTLQITGTQGRLHTLDMLCCSVNLYETVTLSRADSISLCCNKQVPLDGKNTAYRMAEVFFEHTKIQGGVAINIEKTVPIGAGMGGGSADAAAVLIGLDRLYQTNLDTKTLIELGLKVGSDLPVCLVGGLCRVGGVGGDIEVIPQSLPYCFVAIMGGKAVSTAEAYRRFDEQGSNDAADTAKAVAMLGSAEFIDTMKNDLEHSSTLPLDEIKKRFIGLGAKKAMMTGSGAVVYGVYDDIATANQAAQQLGEGAFVLMPTAKSVEILT